MEKKKIYPFLWCSFFCTPLRAIIIALSPIIPKLSKVFFYSKLNKEISILFIISLISSIVGLLRGSVDLANVILFTWVCFPIFYILFCDIEKKRTFISWEKLFKYLRLFLIAIDIIGFVCRFLIFKTVDDFGKAYGEHFKGVSGLCVLNAFVMLYYLSFILKGDYSKKTISYFIFFLCSFIFCFSGLTLITLIIVLFIYLLSNLKLSGNILKIIIVLIIGGFIFTHTATEILKYNTRNIELFLNNADAQDNARKRVMYANFFNHMSENTTLLLTGVGPGGYNSRICFLLNDDSNNIFTSILGNHMPQYHKADIYPLWNNDIVSFDKYTDGARNKPFSSLVGICAEVGIIFFIFFTVFWLKKIIYFRKKAKYDTDYLYLFLLNSFMYLLLATEYWLESSEFILFLLLQNTIISNKINSQTPKHAL